jgi:hypothetical protein
MQVVYVCEMGVHHEGGAVEKVAANEKAALAWLKAERETAKERNADQAAFERKEDLGDGSHWTVSEIGPMGLGKLGFEDPLFYWTVTPMEVCS